MTTAQHAVSNAPFNPPSSVNHFATESRTEEPTTNSIPYPSHVQIDPTPLPWRCQFTFSDGRQCRMPRHELHVCLCKYHARREQEIWGDPECATSQMLEGLFDDLSTATAINRALAQVFRLLAQKRITQREAVAFGYLAQLLLQTVHGVRSEAISAFGHQHWSQSLKSKLNSMPEPTLQPVRIEREPQQTAPEIFPVSAPGNSNTPPRAIALAEPAPPAANAVPASIGNYKIPSQSVPSLADSALAQTHPQLSSNEHLQNHWTLSRAECALTKKRTGGMLASENRSGSDVAMQKW
jgi:hypothetical protein